MPRHYIKHGLTKTRFDRIYWCIRARCYCKTAKSYKDYGGRGITSEWKSFSEFVEDMYEPYLEHFLKNGGDTSIDRIDNNKGYSKENCRWATRLEQAKNKNKTGRERKIKFGGKTQNIKQWAEELGIAHLTLAWRIRHWGLEKAMTQPVREMKNNIVL